VTLEQVGDWFGGGTPNTGLPEYWEGGTIPWFSPKDMKTLRLTEAEDNITERATQQTNVKPSPKGAVLIVVRSGILSRTLPVGVSEVEAAINQDLKGISTFSGIEPYFIAYQLISQERAILHRCCKDGTTVASIEVPRLRCFPLSLAPTNEQHRIVGKIQELFSDLDAGVVALERVRANLKRYRAAVLKSAVEGKLTEDWRAQHPDTEPASVLLECILTERRRMWEEASRCRYVEAGRKPPARLRDGYDEPASVDHKSLPPIPDGWCYVVVEQVAFLKSGQTPSDIKQVLQSSGEVAWFKVGDMNRSANKKLMWEAADFLTSDSARRLGLHIHPSGTIIFPKRGGAIATNKKRILAFPAAYDLNTMGLVPVDGIGDFLWVWLQGIDLSKLSDGSNVPQINNHDIAPLVLALPPRQEQEQIVIEVERRLSVVDEIEAQLDANLKRAARLRQGILKRAFEGRLVPQNPADEPAEKLLERIHQQRQPATKMYNGRLGSRRARRPRRTSDPLLPFPQVDGNGQGGKP
jgi:type I restriction enzyme S subunit